MLVYVTLWSWLFCMLATVMQTPSGAHDRLERFTYSCYRHVIISLSNTFSKGTRLLFPDWYSLGMRPTTAA